MTSESIKNKINQRLNIDIKTNTRDRKHVYARAIYYKLCRDLTNMKLHEIAKTVNRNHASVLHGIKTVFPTLKEYKDPIYKIYVELTEKDRLPLQQKYDLLNHKYLELCKYAVSNKYKKLFDIITKIPEEEITNVECRVSAIVDILNKKK
tara:strand:- start:7423 stop:7872 length:450 start_codon:yes stop_codon:yes gene_type:complete